MHHASAPRGDAFVAAAVRLCAVLVALAPGLMTPAGAAPAKPTPATNLPADSIPADSPRWELEGRAA
ncbi:MAG TPA: hypothetical protein VMQ62_11625, partial [Dongiaceae bacterium]|nr:hypothetical protein [Dongiaceae bacterium]